MKVEILKENNRTVAKLYGEIDHHTAAAARTKIDRMMILERPLDLVIDFENISFMDSSGIGLILGRYKLMKELGGNLEIFCPQPYIRRVLKLSGIERLVRIV